MFPIFNTVIKTATRIDNWDAPDHWRRQQQDYHDRKDDEGIDDARARRRLSWLMFR